MCEIMGIQMDAEGGSVLYRKMPLSHCLALLFLTFAARVVVILDQLSPDEMPLSH